MMMLCYTFSHVMDSHLEGLCTLFDILLCSHCSHSSTMLGPKFILSTRYRHFHLARVVDHKSSYVLFSITKWHAFSSTFITLSSKTKTERWLLRITFHFFRRLLCSITWIDWTMYRFVSTLVVWMRLRRLDSNQANENWQLTSTEKASRDFLMLENYNVDSFAWEKKQIDGKKMAHKELIVDEWRRRLTEFQCRRERKKAVQEERQWAGGERTT